MPRSARLFLCCAFLAAVCPLTASASALWFGDRDGLHLVDPGANRIVADVAFEPAVAIAVNAADGSVWVLTQSRLARLSEQGVVEKQLALRDLGNGLGAPRLLVLNPNDGSVWAAFANRVLHFDADGLLQQTLAVSAQDLAVGQDGSLWVLGQSALQQYDSGGALVTSVPLNGPMQRVKHLALDDTGGAIWIAGEKDLLQLSLSHPGQTLLSLLAPETISAISVDIQTGDLWVLGQNGLLSYGRDGSPRVSRDLRDFAISNPRTLVFDFASQAAWVGHQGGLSRIADGSLVATFPATVHVLAIAIGRTPVDIEPVVSIVSPADGALLNDATPLFRVDYDALCGGASCGFPNSFFSSYSLSAMLNGSEVGPLFVFDPAIGGATFTPAASIPQGLNVFSAQARDAFGSLSNVATVSFTIDTIAPAFTNVAPPDGSAFTTPLIIISGSVDDPSATVTLGAETQGQNFSFAVTLSEGPNDFTLLARDVAGNTASRALRYTFEPIPNAPPTVRIVSPTSGATFSAPASIHVVAEAEDSDGTIARVEFLRNGVLAATVTAPPYEATLTNVPAGTQSLTARAVDDRGGATTSTAVAVTVAATSITITSPAANAFITADHVLVTGRIEALANSGVSVNDNVAAIDVAGNFSVIVPLLAGLNTLLAELTTVDGAVLTQSRSVSATGTPSPFAVAANPMIGLATLPVIFRVSNPTGDNATFTFDTFGPFSLPAGSTVQLSVSYPAGVFVPNVVIRDALARTFTHRLVIESRDPAQMDQMFRALWNGMNNALVAGDKQGALRYLNGNAQQKFGPVFDALMPFMSEIVGSYSALARSSLSAEIGAYAVSRVDNGTKRLYFVYFMRDPDGVWRIDEM